MPGALIISKMIIEKKYFDVYAHESIYPPIWSSWWEDCTAERRRPVLSNSIAAFFFTAIEFRRIAMSK